MVMPVDVENPLLKRPPALNPYWIGGSLIWKRIRWDVRPAAWRSHARLRANRNRYVGEKAVILCNGPSLLKTDFELLRGTFVFGLNKINLLFGRTEFRPSCIVAVNPFVIEQSAGFFNDTTIPLFIDHRGARLVQLRRNVTFLHSAAVPGFAKDCSSSVYIGYTVTYVALQLAFHMGFRRVALVGCDHNFAVDGPPNKTVLAAGTDESHFDPNYFASGVKWQLPDLFQSEISYRMAKQVFEAEGGEVTNCTVGGRLEIFRRQGLSEFLES